MRWLLLFVAIGFETVATSCLKLSKGFTVLWPSVVTAVGYMTSFWFFSQALKRIDLSVAYAIWCAGGILLVTIFSVLCLHEPMTPLKMLFLALIVIGSVGLQLIG